MNWLAAKWLPRNQVTALVRRDRLRPIKAVVAAALARYLESGGRSKLTSESVSTATCP
jgi:hypothetical protein